MKSPAFFLAAAIGSFASGPVHAAIEPQPYAIDWSRAGESAVDLSSFVAAPAGRDGFLSVRGDRIVRPDGSRFRFWGVNLCGPDGYPDPAEAPRIAGDLARMGINVVRFHHMDSPWGGLIDGSRNDTRALSTQSLARLDFFIAELKKRGLYANLNLNVGRNYKEGDGVRDAKLLGMGKAATYFNERLVELQMEFARQLLTHRNPHTGNEYRAEPAVAAVELINENSMFEAWMNGRLEGRDDKPGDTWSPIPASYARELTEIYNRWLGTNRSADEVAEIRREAGVGPAEAVPIHNPYPYTKASKLRFFAEAQFLWGLEQRFFDRMRARLKDELGVRPIVVGTADHNDWYAAYAHVYAMRTFDLVDGHGYWEHPRLGAETWIKNTPMVNDPLDSTVVQFARTPVAGKPFTISEVNHPFPHEYACEGFPILTAYALFQDWDGIYWFTYGRGRLADPKEGIRNGGWFDFSNDPVKMATLHACGLMWHRRDLAAATQTVVRAYGEDGMIEALRLPRAAERPFFTPGFAKSTPLEHRVLCRMDGGPATAFPPPAAPGAIEADTGEIGWYGADRKRGLVVVQSPRTEALIGFVKDGGRRTRHLTAAVENEFCALTLTALDGKPLASSSRLLLVAGTKVTNTGQTWKDDHQTLAEWGRGPVLIEPVTGSITLRSLDGATSVRARPLAAEGRPLEENLPVEPAKDGWTIRLGRPATVWCVVDVGR